DRVYRTVLLLNSTVNHALIALFRSPSAITLIPVMCPTFSRWGSGGMCVHVPLTSVQAPIHNGHHRPCGNAPEGVYYAILFRETDGMVSPPACTNSHGAHGRSRQLIRDSHALLAEVQEVLQDARHMLARQRYRKIVCAWCQQTIRWERCAPDAWAP